ncbi:MAG: hypothetical protein MR779_01645 [Tenericutes bacterium]|nr:hypothetical protein [Mycoplasmatota bacterium]
MNNNFEAIKSLISLLVKKAGFDLDKNYSEVELEKTKSSIEELTYEKNNSNNKKAISNIIDNLRVRQANWENNAEIVGKSLIEAYQSGKDYQSIKARIELLGSLAVKGTENLGVGSIYSKLTELEKKYEELNTKIETNDYKNLNEKEMDERYKTYLENKITSFEVEVENLNKELESLRDIELKDVNIVNKIKEYIDKMDSDLERINKALSTSVNSDISFEVFERLENAKEELEVKSTKDKETLSKAESMLDNVRKNRININERKGLIENEIDKLNGKLTNVKIKLDENDYTNQIEKIIDVNELERVRLELESLKNKKDVVYVDAVKVKEELIKEWNTSSGKTKAEQKEENPELESNVDNTVVINNENSEKVESEEKNVDNEEVVNTENEKEEEKDKVVEVEKEKKHKRIELDW